MEEHEHEQRAGDLEEHAYVLDYMPTGRSYSVKSEPLVQLLGSTRFTLLEAVPKVPDIKIEEKLYIGKGVRDKISLIKSRLAYDNLTEGSRKELPLAIGIILHEDEKKFVDFFNHAAPLNIRTHTLELLPGIGKKHLQAILEAREEKEFESFADITKRVALLQDPVKLLTERVLIELRGESRFYILSRPEHHEFPR